MSPARASDNGPDFHRHLHRILLDITLLRWFATIGGQGLAVILALVAARREGTNGEVPILDFLERHVGGGSAS